MSAQHSDVVVLGGGVIGLSCAIALLDAGRGVTVIERARTGRGSSHGNCGTITPSHAAPLAAPGVVATALRWMFTPDAPLRIKLRLDPALLRWLFGFAARCNGRDYQSALAAKAPLLLYSRQRLGELIARESMASEFEELGTLVVHRDAEAFAMARHHVDELRGVGIPVDVLDGAATLALEPALKPGVAGSFRYPGDAQLRPDRHLAELARVVRAKGGVIIEDAPVQGIVRDGGRITRIECPGAIHVPGDVVLATGAWSPTLARQMDLRIPIQPGKGYSITYSRPRRAPRIPMTLKDRSVCVTAWQSGFRIGSTMEFAGYDESLNQARLNALRRAAMESLLDPIGPEQVEEWFGWRPMTPDDLPLIGRVGHVGNLVVATGHGMLGMTMSAGTADVVADLLLGRESPIDIRPFDPSRFG